MRPIDADALYMNLVKMKDFGELTAKKAIRAVENEPTVDLRKATQDYASDTTIDAEPVRHGKNIGTDYDEVDQFVCSECGIELQDWRRVERDDYDGEKTYHEYRLRYCPNCGARIDEE